MTKPIRNSAKAVIIHNGNVLLTKNQDSTGIFYLFPGGGQEKGEELKDAVVRECMEELGAEVEVGDLLTVREYIGSHHEFARWDADVHQVEFYFSCRLRDPGQSFAHAANPDEKQIGVEWVKLQDLPDMRVFPRALCKELSREKRPPFYLGDIS
ncbi:ADP-ribose pyrophosphatase [Xylanibacillus composti]|uniref:ADP-ribose pyrophosphatase n=1 Tax=Xylanibacillus composti TaxID=1572762 RepID=A0A8J4M3K2_9BACL|nr:NUDIX domain-containing protein [Xylanibacillus composti]GIQ69591.1 ADP-ribose pyrophosphatase [Xylanibacillus composti]